MKEPLAPSEAKHLILAIIEHGAIKFSPHARREMAEDDLTDQDALNVLRGGVVEPAEQHNGTWRYRVRTSRMYFVVAFPNETTAAIVTAWRKR